VSQLAEFFFLYPQERSAMLCGGTQSKKALASRADRLGGQR
jgi:hypothetical protein